MSAMQKRCAPEGDYMKQIKKEKSNNVLPVPMGAVKPCPIVTDPQGCYTGRPLELYEQPVQDADDL